MDSPATKEVTLPGLIPDNDELNGLDPKKFICMGEIDPDHDECQGCPARKMCAEKAGIVLED